MWWNWQSHHLEGVVGKPVRVHNRLRRHTPEGNALPGVPRKEHPEGRHRNNGRNLLVSYMKQINCFPTKCCILSQWMI